MPLVVFGVISVILQALNLLFSLAIENYISKGVSVTAFAILYLVVFWIAWRLTVWIIDSRRARLSQVDEQKLLAVLFAVTQLPLMA